MLTAERNRLGSVPRELHREIRAHIRWLEHALKSAIVISIAYCANSPLWREQEDLLRGVPGQVRCCAQPCSPGCRNWGRLNRREIAALVRVAPLNHDSGTLRDRRTVWGGQANLRAALYTGTLVGVHYNPVLRTLYRRLLGRGKAITLFCPTCADGEHHPTLSLLLAPHHIDFRVRCVNFRGVLTDREPASHQPCALIRRTQPSSV